MHGVDFQNATNACLCWACFFCRFTGPDSFSCLCLPVCNFFWRLHQPIAVAKKPFGFTKEGFDGCIIPAIDCLCISRRIVFSIYAIFSHVSRSFFHRHADCHRGPCSRMLNRRRCCRLCDTAKGCPDDLQELRNTNATWCKVLWKMWSQDAMSHWTNIIRLSSECVTSSFVIAFVRRAHKL